MAFPKIDGYIVTEKLGSGSYSTVFKAHTKVGARSIVAIKCVDKSRIKNSGSAIDNLITEIRLLKTLTHPHIVHMKNFTWDDKNIYIIMEYCCGGDLSKYIQKYGRVPERQVLYFLQQLASALKFLREQNVVHMDLKPHNLLLHKDNGKYILKVADFGFAQYMSRDCSRSVRGSPLYMAPEMIFGEYDARVDLWSVGVIMYECLFGKAPYSSGTFKELIDKIQRKAPIEIPPNSSISGGCRDLLTRLLQHDPDNRISYEEFFNHDYLDLEHMPNKENYEKAVSLIKKAVELDSAGKVREAFEAYRDSLRYLVPVVHSERDAVRRGALTDKLTRYMERAEELKSLLRGDSRATAARPSRDVIPDVTSHCCGNVADTCYNKYAPAQVSKMCDNCKSFNCSCAKKPSESAERSVSYKAGSDKCSESEKSDSRSSTPAAMLKRLFSRHTPPLLYDKDSSITDDSATSDKKTKDKTQNDNTTDACKIT